MALSDLLGMKPTHDARERFEALCRDVDAGLNHFRKMGDALAEIRGSQLYRYEAETFEAFVKKRWGMTPQHANRLMTAALVCKELEPLGSVPQNEHQARPLGRLSGEDRKAAWKEATEHADEQGNVPPAAIRAAVEKRSPKRPRKTKSLRPIRIRVPGASVVIEPNKSFTTPEAVLEGALKKLREQPLARAA